MNNLTPIIFVIAMVGLAIFTINFFREEGEDEQNTSNNSK